MGLTGARTTDLGEIPGTLQEPTAMQRPDRNLIDLADGEGETCEALVGGGHCT